MASSNPLNKEILHDVPPYLTVYKDGTIKRHIGTETTPPSLDSITGVESKDIIITPETNVSARIYKPTINHHKKLPLVIYFHGGAFLISSTSDPKYHEMLNKLVEESNIILVSINYRLAPENPLPTAYDDSWEAIKWVASHNSIEGGSEIWIKDFVDFSKIFLAGDSAGANISHHMAIQIGSSNPGLGEFKVVGILMVHPYFWGEEAIGVEVENPFFKAVVDEWWRFVCPSDLGGDDPWINPFVNGSPGLEKLACDRVVVFVAGNDVLRERGILYYESLVKSGWKGRGEVVVTEGEDHVFHIFDSGSEKAVELIKRCAKFINRE